MLALEILIYALVNCGFSGSQPKNASYYTTFGICIKT